MKTCQETDCLRMTVNQGGFASIQNKKFVVVGNDKGKDIDS